MLPLSNTALYFTATKIMLTQKSATATKLQKKLLSQKSSEKLLKMLQDKEKKEEKKKPSRFNAVFASLRLI